MMLGKLYNVQICVSNLHVTVHTFSTFKTTDAMD